MERGKGGRKVDKKSWGRREGKGNHFEIIHSLFKNFSNFPYLSLPMQVWVDPLEAAIKKNKPIVSQDELKG